MVLQGRFRACVLECKQRRNPRRIGRQELSFFFFFWLARAKAKADQVALARISGSSLYSIAPSNWEDATLARLLDRSSFACASGSREPDVQAGGVECCDSRSSRTAKCRVRFSAWDAVTNLDPACLSSLVSVRQSVYQNAFGWANAKETLNGYADDWACSHIGGVGG